MPVVPRLKVSIVIDAPPSRVWAEVEDIASHPTWMQDAVSIEFTSSSTSGVGTTFDCLTKIGPFRLVDRMKVTSWRPDHEMGVRHAGLVTGTGRFELRRARRGRTKFTWVEHLYFPWYFGGPIGATVARPVLRRVWRTNLRNLAGRFDEPGSVDGSRRSRRRRRQ